MELTHTLFKGGMRCPETSKKRENVLQKWSRRLAKKGNEVERDMSDFLLS